MGFNWEEFSGTKTFVVNDLQKDTALRKLGQTILRMYACFICAFPLLVLASSRDVARDLEDFFGFDWQEIRGFFRVLFIALLVYFFTNVALFFDAKKERNRLSGIRVYLGATEVQGTASCNTFEMPQAFSLGYTQIEYARAFCQDGLNLAIYTKNGKVYRCLYIDRAEEAAELINQRCRAQRKPASCNPQPVTREAAPVTDAAPQAQTTEATVSSGTQANVRRYCKRCWSELSEGETLCKNCGAEQ